MKFMTSMKIHEIHRLAIADRRSTIPDRRSPITDRQFLRTSSRRVDISLKAECPQLHANTPCSRSPRKKAQPVRGRAKLSLATGLLAFATAKVSLLAGKFGAVCAACRPLRHLGARGICAVGAPPMAPDTNNNASAGRGGAGKCKTSMGDNSAHRREKRRPSTLC